MNTNQTLDLSPAKYRLQSMATGQVFDDDGWSLEAPGESIPGLIRAIYPSSQIHIKDPSYGFFRFADWLPIHRMLPGSSAPITYQSIGLAKVLGLSRLFITFSGYWPEREALMKTCSFKETEAYAVCARLNKNSNKVLVVASAGNTARSFARVCSDHDIQLLLCVPEDNLDALWFDQAIGANVKLIVSASGSDYYDAIYLSQLACLLEGFIAEGGAKNVARRDGMGTTVLSAVTTIGRIPDYYFQAIGSGTGAIAAWEANLRLIADGRFGKNKMKLIVSQNFPFVPIYDAWKAGSSTLLPFDDNMARKQVEEIDAKVLSNRKPPYALAGGLYDALKDTGGEVVVNTNQEAIEAGALFTETEGIDIHPAAAIATASLIKAMHEKRIDKDACIMLNITGGGEQKFKNEKQLHHIKPDLVLPVNPNPDEVVQAIIRLYSK